METPNGIFQSLHVILIMVWGLTTRLCPRGGDFMVFGDPNFKFPTYPHGGAFHSLLQWLPVKHYQSLRCSKETENNVVVRAEAVQHLPTVLWQDTDCRVPGSFDFDLSFSKMARSQEEEIVWKKKKLLFVYCPC